MLFIILTGCNFLFAQKKTKQAPKQTVTRYGYFPRSVFYDIYVPSFCDFNNDSIGDIKGITHQLNYISSFGAEAVTLSPLTWTLDKDKKGSIDFQTIDPQLGTLADLKELITEAHKLNINVVLSLNINYTGLQHPWFVQAEKNYEFQSYYIWKKSPDIKNLKKNFYELKKYSDKYYSYESSELPCLNYSNVKVRNAVIAACKYWLLQTNADGIKFQEADKIYTGNDSEKLKFWGVMVKELQKAKPGCFIIAQPSAEFSEYEKMVSENFNACVTYGLTQFIHSNIIAGKDGGIVMNYNAMHDSLYKASHGFLDMLVTGHEQSIRLTQGLTPQQTKAAVALLLTMPPSVSVFYGDELGMTGTTSRRNNLEPFAWNYTEADDNRTFYIPDEINNNAEIVPYAVQLSDGNSLYHFYRKLCWIRKQNDILREGSVIAAQNDDKRLVAFYRDMKTRRLLILQNISGSDVYYDLEKDRTFKFKNLFSNSVYPATEVGAVKISPYATLIYQSN